MPEYKAGTIEGQPSSRPAEINHDTEMKITLEKNFTWSWSCLHLAVGDPLGTGVTGMAAIVYTLFVVAGTGFKSKNM